MNFLTKHAKLDLCGDETSWATASYVEVGGGLTDQIANNTGVTKGGHIVLVSNAHSIMMHAYRHSVSLASVHVTIQRNSTYVQTVRRSVYDTRRP